MRTFVITGASRGLGAALAQGLPDPADHAILIARRPPAEQRPGRTWVSTDLALGAPAVEAIAQAVGDRPVDVLICNVGIWESRAFTDGYDFATSDDAESRRIIEVNALSAIMLVRALLPRLRASSNPKVVIVGSISALDNAGAREVAFAASKFAQRGIAHALRESLRQDRVGVTLLNPGYLATDEVLGDVGPGGEQRTIPLDDIVLLVRAALATSRRTCVKQIDVPAMLDRE